MKLQVDDSEGRQPSQGLLRRGNQGSLGACGGTRAIGDDSSERSSVRHDQWTLAIVRGGLDAAQVGATTFLREAEDAGRPVETGVAHPSSVSSAIIPVTS